MKGKIVKGIGGFYYVHCKNKKTYECRAKGIFRNESIKPIVGDVVEISIIDDENCLGNLDKIYPRKNELIRPLVSNVDQAVIVFSVKNPKPNFLLLDKFLILMERKGIDTLIVFNKVDILDDEKFDTIINDYKRIGYQLTITSVELEIGVDDLKKLLKGKTSVFAGPSGVGKSSILNIIQNEIKLQTGKISNKISRGKHTTRHTTLINFAPDTYVVDTPGFTSFSIDDIDADELKHYFIEFDEYESKCKFGGCNHISEPKCGVKEAVANKEISETRYENYKYLYNNLKDLRKKY